MHRNRITCVVLIGTIPPPFGGVSIHIKRLAQKLVESGVECYIISSIAHSQMINGVNIINVKSNYAVLFHCLKLLPKKPIYHFHTMWSDGLAKFFLKIFRGKLVSTMHDTMLFDKYLSLSRKRRFICKSAIRLRQEKYIAVNKEIQSILLMLGIALSNTFIIPAYLPDEENQPDELPKSIISYTKRNDLLILVYGWRVSFNKNKQDVYGFNTAMEVYSELLKSRKDTGMIFLIPSGNSDEYIKLLANQFNLNDEYLLVNTPIKNMSNLLSLISVYFRPSITDGDSILVRESLSIGTRVVASNVVNRPDGTYIFNNMVSEYVDGLNYCLTRNKSISESSDYYEEIVKVYDLV